MISRALFVVALIMVMPKAWCQVINQDAEGKSSIISPGGTIGIDIQAASIKANYYTATDRTSGLLLGGELQGKSETGLASLFNKGDFVPSGRLSGLVGYQWTKGSSSAGITEIEMPDGTKAEARYQELAKEELAKQDLSGCSANEREKYVSGIVKFIGIKAHSWDDISKIAQIIFALPAADLPPVISPCEAKFQVAVAAIQARVNADELIQDFLRLRAAAHTPPVTLAEQDAYAKTKREIEKRYSNKSYLYLRGGVNAIGFTYDRTATYTNVSSRFRDTSAVLPFIELGLTRRIRGQHYIGLAGGFERISSYSLLDKSVYKYTATSVALTGGSIGSSKDIIAYNGDFRKSHRVYFNFDYVWLKPLERPNYFAANPYLRVNSKDSDDLSETNVVLGIGAYFLDGKSGKFLGGVYLQSNDISGNTESSLEKSLAFGLIAKFAFSSLYGPGQN